MRPDHLPFQPRPHIGPTRIRRRTLKTAPSFSLIAAMRLQFRREKMEFDSYWFRKASSGAGCVVRTDRNEHAGPSCRRPSPSWIKEHS